MRESIKRLIDHKLKEAKKTISHLGLDLKTNTKLNILELGCGMGCLGKVIKDYGHNIICCDDLNYTPKNFQKKYNIEYKKIIDDLEVFRHHFFYHHPLTEKNLKKNKKMFANLKSYDKQEYDLIIWQASDLWQESSMGIQETTYLVENLTKLLTTKGKLLIGFNPVNGHHRDETFEQTESYKWLAKWSTQEYFELGFYRWEILIFGLKSR